MPRQVLNIHGKFPGLNEMIGSARTNRFGNASMKKKWTKHVAKAAWSQLKKINYPVEIACLWIEGNNRRDLDNVAAAVKFVLDGLVVAGILPDDSRKWVKSITHGVATSRDKSYGVVVTLDY